MAHDYAESTRRWEEAKSLIQSLNWRWVPNEGQDDPMGPQTQGVMQCEAKDLPAGKKPEDVIRVLQEYGELKPSTPQGEQMVISIPCRLIEFEGDFGMCFQLQKHPLVVREEFVPGKKAVTDYAYHLSHKGNDIYVFMPSPEEAGELKRALIDKNIKVSLIIPIDGGHRLAIPINQKKKLEVLGIEVKPYTRRETPAEIS